MYAYEQVYEPNKLQDYMYRYPCLCTVQRIRLTFQEREKKLINE